MKIHDIMSKDVVIVDPMATLHEVAQKMHQQDCGSVVVAENDRLLGIITDRDIALRCVAFEHDPAQTTADKIMSPQILYCWENDESDDVLHNMAANKVRRMPVLNEKKRLVGIVSLGDLSKHTNYELCGRTLGDICRAA